nr:immunoglobulin light chain junction region [Macaca mulatta]MOX33391.1 immunoglobulin light chain junction region [Macaca mulatta]MOX35080.1 immunoglobulin light chain junction region [Macaca mulatta]MOX35324.1 immunoglobulin light chain junction region [Macaca mulatta]MOX35410.1 immunoglobulin light chain junction region [Macaca mulatta]
DYYCSSYASSYTIF